jgi:flagellar motor switch protein FliM
MASDAKAEVKVLGHSGALKPGTRIKPYDFRRPDKFSKDQIRTVSIMHETFTRLTTTTVSATLRCLAHMHVESVDQLTYEEFIRSIPNPSTLAVINMDPLKGSALLEIDPGITFAMIDRLFGGTGRDAGLDRDLTDIEQSVMGGIVVRVLGNLRESWNCILDLRPRLGQIETNPMFAQIVPPTEMVILVTFEFRIEGVAGRINLCIPYLTIEPIIGKLSAKYWYSSPRLGEKAVHRDVSRLKVDAEVFFKAKRLSLAGIGRLGKNSFVKLEDADTACLEAGGRIVCRLKTRKVKGRFIFDVDPPETGPGRAGEAELLAGAGAGQQGDAAHLEQLVRAPLEKLSTDMTNALETIAGKINALQKRQDELGDRIFRGTPLDGTDTGAPESEEYWKPYSFVNDCDKDAFFNLLTLEHPQTKAMILSFLDPTAAADFLSRLSEQDQADIAERIGLIGPCAPEVIREVERVLEKKLLWNKKESLRLSDAVTLVNILNVVERKVEKNVVNRLEKSNPGLAEQVKRNMFVFEDVVLLDPGAVKRLVPKIDPRDLVIALKAVDEKIKNHFLTHLAPEKLKAYQNDYQAAGPVRLTDVEAAQQRIIGIIREMEENGEIIVARPGELVE